jgi:hypothetical protein
MDINFEKWIRTIVDTEKPSKKIIGYYFGIFESEAKQYTLYLTGSEEFDEKDEDWACNDDFEPKDKYLSLSQYKGLKWDDVLNKIIIILNEFIITDLYKNSFFFTAQKIATGFDDGNLVFIK